MFDLQQILSGERAAFEKLRYFTRRTALRQGDEPKNGHISEGLSIIEREALPAMTRHKKSSMG